MADKEEMLDILFCGYVVPAITGTEHKRQAVERYMRTYLRSLLTGEIEFELKYCDDNNSLSSMLQLVVDKASQGYDRFMARRKAKVA